jgi:hypothetical protein
MAITTVGNEECRSLGDAMRDLVKWSLMMRSEPGVFVKIAQNVAHNIFCKNYYSMFAKEKSSLKMWALL